MQIWIYRGRGGREDAIFRFFENTFASLRCMNKVHAAGKKLPKKDFIV